MDKRYQVFVSSTYADLQDERRKVIQALMEMDCIPAGMELFPAADDEQWNFIKRVIDDCDYYILIMGGRYGTLTSDGISYTELEFDYAITKGIKVLAFVHGEPGNIALAKSDIDPVLREKLSKFRDKVCQDRLVKFWKTAEELPGLVALSLQKTIKIHPAIGWVRANTIANTDALVDLNSLRKENAELRARLAANGPSPPVDRSKLAKFDDVFELVLTFDWRSSRASPWHDGKETIKPSWAHIFGAIAPELQELPRDSTVKSELARALCAMYVNRDFQSPSMSEDAFKTVRIQFLALGLIKVQHLKTTTGGMGFFWSLTPKGESLMFEVRTVKAAQ